MITLANELLTQDAWWKITACYYGHHADNTYNANDYTVELDEVQCSTGVNWYLYNHNLVLTVKVIHSGSNGNVFVTVQA